MLHCLGFKETLKEKERKYQRLISLKEYAAINMACVVFELCQTCYKSPHHVPSLDLAELSKEL